jgi:hypothetical protein
MRLLVRLLEVLVRLARVLVRLLEVLVHLLEVLVRLMQAGAGPWVSPRGSLACGCNGWNLACALIGGSRLATGHHRRCST